MGPSSQDGLARSPGPAPADRAGEVACGILVQSKGRGVAQILAAQPDIAQFVVAQRGQLGEFGTRLHDAQRPEEKPGQGLDDALGSAPKHMSPRCRDAWNDAGR